MLTLKRYAVHGDSVMGLLFDKDGFICYILENKNHVIPFGQYKIKAHLGGRFDQMATSVLGSKYNGMPHIDVPGRQYILIHTGNLASDSSGCLICGMSATYDTVGDSRRAFKAYYERFMNSGEIRVMEAI